MNIEKVKSLFNIINVTFEESKVSFSLKFLSYEKDLEQFIRLSLFPLSYFFNGSEFPIIDKKFSLLEI